VTVVTATGELAVLADPMRHRQPATMERTSALLEEEVLAIEEQEEVVMELERLHTKQTRNWLRVFAGLAFASAAGLLYLAWLQATDPWGMKHHAKFARVLPAPVVALAELGSAASVAAAGLALTWNRPVVGPEGSSAGHLRLACLAKYAALCGSMLMAVLWGLFLIVAGHAGRLGIRGALEVLWLPLAPLIFVLLALYVIYIFSDTRKDLLRLRGSMYHLRTI
jgi:hypothetical protein